MKENRKGFILPLKEVNNIADIEAPDKVMVLNDKGQPRMVKRKNDNELLDIYPFCVLLLHSLNNSQSLRYI